MRQSGKSQGFNLGAEAVKRPAVEGLVLGAGQERPEPLNSALRLSSSLGLCNERYNNAMADKLKTID